ncbi:MAG: NAD(P)/FAD-dependent oxidoreductase [Nitrospirae bacterium]|nr:NAD(P)/FAD-dependent oxidoreductase [Nitrospirota bacterium]
MSQRYDYEAIIIGAGISGLVCGCYLAKAGLKTLIVEKNAGPGGYCTSFKRGGFQFDACVHSLGSLRTGGNVRTILQELDIEERLRITRHDPSDIIIAPDFTVHYWNDIDKTVSDFQNIFPAESENIRKFFDYIQGCEGIALMSLKSVTFQMMLDRYFNDYRLKAVLSLPVLGNAGLPPSKISSVTAVLIYKEFMLDGGYCPDGSVQALADILAARFREFGGDIFFSCAAKRIKIEEGKVLGVETAKNDIFSSKYLISSIDATSTYMSLIGETASGQKIMSLLNKMEPSLSAFILYLGTDGKLENVRKDSVIWSMPHYDIDNIYNLTVQGKVDELDWFLSRLSSNHSLFMFVNVPFVNEAYWQDNKRRLIDIYINKMERIFPDLSRHIIYKDAATPMTLNKWTSNHKGASYGWAKTPSQFAVTGFTQNTAIENLYLTGHWTTLYQGVGGVAYLGRDTSNKILKKETAQ